MRMIFTHRIADDTGTFSVRLVGTVVQFTHGVEDSSLYRLEAVSYIRKSSGRNDAHRVVDIRILHSLLKIDFLYSVKNSFFHVEPFSQSALDIQILHEFGVFFDKLSSGLYFVSHQCCKGQIHL